ncbi:copper oxidase [Labrys miyagiensis]|uniref:Copper oxidase n=1 Tax=Labrys miyagiensis TaxID=346912 RepID=A0ABQ6CQY4_9HYPH|nr:multicopper oxidase family protein [Labrys miyagiensis]GLS22757.1 copper oxidase [Labrys miyagiensis]
MNRRSFLLAGAAMLSLLRPVAAQQPDHSMHAMPGMDMGGGDQTLTAAPALPEGAPLRELPRLASRSQQAGVFEAELTAAPASTSFVPGLETPILAYNGITPGPVIEVFEGDRVSITFRNRLPDQESTIHWHGLPVPADQDGNPVSPVLPDAEQTYSFEPPKGSAGTYWYHPHPHGKTASQVYRGLAGAFLVKAKDDPIPASYGDTLFVFTDLRLAADGTLPESTMADLMNGRVGDHVLVNGQKNPVLTVAVGEFRRFRLLNATNARFLRLSLAGASLTLIGSDGGLLETPVADADELFLAPAERLEIVARFDKPGTMSLRTLGYDRGWMGPNRPEEAGKDLLTVRVSEDRGPSQPPLPGRLRPIPDLGPPAVTRRFVFTETMSMGAGGMEMGFLINGAAFHMNRVDVVSKAGQVELWEIANQADMDHPFHLHGTQFQIVERESEGKVTKPAFRALKDTVNVRRGETVRILLRQDLPGPRMYHCHILEHEDLGMMGLVNVEA